MHRSTRLAVAALAAGALVLAACGSDGGDDAATTTSAAEATTTTAGADAEFSQSLDALCVQGKADANQASDDLTAALQALGQAAQDRDQAAYADALAQAEAATTDIIGVFDDFQAAVADLDVPADLQPPLDDYLAAQTTQRDLAQQLHDAIAADDGDAYNAAVSAIQDADQSTTQARVDAAAALDAPDCAPDDTTDSGAAGGDTTTTEVTDTTTG